MKHFTGTKTIQAKPMAKSEAEKELNRKIEIVLRGDSELRTFIEALEFAVDTLKQQQHGEAPKTGQTKQQKAFTEYLCDVMRLYSDTKGLKGISGIRHKYHVAGLSKEQFYELGLHILVKQGVDVTTNLDYINSVYEYALRRIDVPPTWRSDSM
ncbi:MAG: hypothetical protein IJ197_08820 [Bacteroidaceae bacterium]|nr:hypothetical protein [Bacteroidaceae bacterium]